MNDDELDLWLSIQNEQLDAQINAKIDLELRRQQLRSAAASAPPVDEPDLAEAHAIWSERTNPTGPRPERVPSARGRVRRSTTRPGFIRPKRSSTYLSPRVSVPRGRRNPAHATRGMAVVLVVLCLLVASALIGDFANQWGAAPPPRERGKTIVIGVPTNVGDAGMAEADRYGFAYDLADWLAEDLNYSPKTFYSFSDLDGFPDYYMEMLGRGEVDMIIDPEPITGQRETEVLFAGPYLLTQGGVLVRSGGAAIRTIDDLDGKRVCTWGESTYKEQSMRLGNSVPIEKDALASCVEALAAGSVDAVAGDQLLLSETAKGEGANTLSVVPGLNFGGQQRYGIELEPDRVGDCNEIRDAIRQFITSGAWDHAFQANMPDVPAAAHKPDPDHLDRCG